MNRIKPKKTGQVQSLDKIESALEDNGYKRPDINEYLDSEIRSFFKDLCDWKQKVEFIQSEQLNGRQHRQEVKVKIET